MYYFSVIIPLYNKAYSIKECIDSVISQSYKNFEIIVVNDGSTDNSLSIVLNSFIAEIDRGTIKIINQLNQGVSVARNNGVRVAKANFICFLDADDKWYPHFLSKMYILTRDYPLANLYCLQHETSYDLKKTYRNPSYYKDGFRGYVGNFFKASLYGSIAKSSKICIPVEAFIKTGGFPPSIKAGEDLYIWIELALSNKVAFENSVCTTVYVKEDNSREGRDHSIPYPLIHYSNPVNYTKLNFWAKIYLRRLYLAHIKESIKNKDFEGALIRIDAGSKLFPHSSKLSALLLKCWKNNYCL